MTTMAGPRKTVSIHDYPEHLNPFREEDNHNKIRFWTIGRKLSRSNSITFSGIKDFRNSWSLRSFMKKGKKGEQASSQSNKTNQVNGEASPIVYRRALQYSSGSGARSTVGSPERADRYVYGGSVTPLPRSRFQERLRTSQQEVSSPSATPRMARSDITGSRLSVESTNPFDEAPIPPIRASRRKKKRAPPPPSDSAADDSVTSENLELRITEPDESKTLNVTADDEIDEMNLKIELKIVEDEDNNNLEIKPSPDTSQDDKGEEGQQILVSDQEETKDIENNSENQTNEVGELEQRSESVKDLASEEHFPKIDIVKYRRNSSVDEDDIRLRRGNLEDFHSLSNKRSKSLTNTADNTYIAYDINLNQNKIDINSNEEPQKVVCKVYDESRKQSIDNSISSTEKEFLEIDKATRELEREISKLNTALNEDDLTFDNSRLSVSEIRQKFDRNGANSPNPIPKPRRSHYGESSSPANGNLQV